MSERPPRAPRSRRALGRRMLGSAGSRADRALDSTERQVFRLLWLFVPEPEIARGLRFQHLLASRFLSEAAQQSIRFGSLVAVARAGGSSLEVALVGVAALVPPALLGLHGGAVADALPKRVALAAAYSLQALLCFAVPATFGTDLGEVLALIFVINVLGQVSGPTESSVLPLVATETELASAVAMINLAAAAGAGFGTALLAPVLVRAFSVELMLYVAGALLLLSASRVFDLPVVDKEFKLRLARPRVSVRAAVRWLVRHPAVATMILMSVLAGTVDIVLLTLAPRYVQDVLNTDPADTAYVFAPSAIGLVVALVLAPSIMKVRGERVTTMVGLFLAVACLFLLGVVGDVAKVVDAVNPLRVSGLFGLDLSERLRTAGLLAMPLAFGVSLTATSVQTYINRRVPLGYQGRTFAMQSALRNGAAIIPLLALAAAAGQFGVEKVLLTSPLLLLATGYALVTLSFRFAGLAPPSRLEVMESFWEEPEGAGRRK